MQRRGLLWRSVRSRITAMINFGVRPAYDGGRRPSPWPDRGRSTKAVAGRASTKHRDVRIDNKVQYRAESPSCCWHHGAVATLTIMQPVQSISGVSMIKDALIVYFDDGKRVILKPEVIYALPSDSGIEAEISQYDSEFESYEN